MERRDISYRSHPIEAKGKARGEIYRDSRGIVQLPNYDETTSGLSLTDKDNGFHDESVDPSPNTLSTMLLEFLPIVLVKSKWIARWTLLSLYYKQRKPLLEKGK